MKVSKNLCNCDLTCCYHSPQIVCIVVGLILVNNGSRDKTSKILDRMANHRTKIVSLVANSGYGGGLITGLHYCTGDYLGYTSGDGQIKAEDVVSLYKKIKSEGVDWGKGLRIERNYSIQRKLISKAYNFIFHFVFHMPSKDINGIPKIFRRDIYEKLNIISTDWFIDAEIMFKTQQLNLSFTEIPLVFYERAKGQSNVNMLTVLEFIINMIEHLQGKKFKDY